MTRIDKERCLRQGCPNFSDYCPQPDHWVRGVQRDGKIKARIRKLLAQALDTPFEPEARACLEKARMLHRKPSPEP